MTMKMNGKAGRYTMSQMGAQLKVTFKSAGTYRFNLIDRGDYFANIKTVGPWFSATTDAPTERSGDDPAKLRRLPVMHGYGMDGWTGTGWRR